MTDHLPECLTPDDPCADPDFCDSLACSRQRLHMTLRDEADIREGNVRMIETSGHLPEPRRISAQSIAFGFMGDEGDPTYNVQYVLASEHDEAIRACEARVSAFYNAEIEKQGAQWEASCRQYYRSGSDDGKSLALSAARDAVAALPCFGAAEQGHNDAALAAIDALKEDK